MSAHFQSNHFASAHFGANHFGVAQDVQVLSRAIKQSRGSVESGLVPVAKILARAAEEADKRRVVIDYENLLREAEIASESAIGADKTDSGLDLSIDEGLVYDSLIESLKAIESVENMLDGDELDSISKWLIEMASLDAVKVIDPNINAAALVVILSEV